MSDNYEIAKRVVRILRIIADKIETNPAMLKDTELILENIPSIESKKKIEEISSVLDIYQIFAEGGEEALRQKLEALDLTALKGIIRLHGFDPGKLAEKWRKRDRLLKLIVDRVSARRDKGKVFEEYP